MKKKLFPLEKLGGVLFTPIFPAHGLLKWVSSLQGGEYGTDEEEEDEEEVSPPYPSAIEVFDLAENEDLSPLETDPEKLAHKYKEVRKYLLYWIISSLITADSPRGA